MQTAADTTDPSHYESSVARAASLVPVSGLSPENTHRIDRSSRSAATGIRGLSAALCREGDHTMVFPSLIR